MSRLTLRQNNKIKDEINGCFYQPKYAVNLIRLSCDKFENFGAVAGGATVWYNKSKNICFEINFDSICFEINFDYFVEEITRFTKALYLNCVLGSNVFASLRDIIFLSNDSSRC